MLLEVSNAPACSRGVLLGLFHAKLGLMVRGLHSAILMSTCVNFGPQLVGESTTAVAL